MKHLISIRPQYFRMQLPNGYSVVLSQRIAPMVDITEMKPEQGLPQNLPLVTKSANIAVLVLDSNDKPFNVPGANHDTGLWAHKRTPEQVLETLNLVNALEPAKPQTFHLDEGASLN